VNKLTSKSKDYHIGKKMISNTFYLFLDWFVIAVLSFIFWALLGKTLNRTEVGIVATSNNLVTLITVIATLGLSRALKKLVPEFKTSKGLKTIFPLTRFSLKPLLISLSIITVILLIFSNYLSSLIKIPYHAFLIIITSIIAYSLYEFFDSVIYGLQNMRWRFITDSIQITLRLGITALLIFFGLSFYGPLIAFFSAYFLVSFIKLNPLRLKSGRSPITYGQLFYYAFPGLIATLSVSLIVNFQFVILTIFQKPEITGVFAIASVISTAVGMAVQTLVAASFPIISALSPDKKTKQKQGYLIGLVVRYSLFLTIPLALVLISFPEYAVLLISKEEFLSSTKYFPLLVPAVILWALGTNFNLSLYAIKKPKLYRNIMLVPAISFILLSLILTPNFSAYGISFSYFMAMLLFFSLSFVYIRKHLKINLFLKDILKILFSSLIVISIPFVLRSFIVNTLMFIALLVPVALIYLILLLLTKFFRSEDVKILEYFGNKIPIIGKYILSVANFLRAKTQ
jgi:O-antigen/teichoic acid export membrane protein